MRGTPEQRKKWKRAFYLRHKERLLVAMKAKYAANPVPAKQRYWNNREAVLAQKKVERAANIEKFRERDRLSYLANKERISQAGKARRDANRESIRTRNRQLYAENKEVVLRRKRLAANTPFGKVRTIAANSVKRILDKGGAKEVDTVAYLGCSIAEAKAHIERHFLTGMTWENHGIHGWHVDHVKPLASFDFTNPKQAYEALHYTNLAPLWARDNLSKGSKL